MVRRRRLVVYLLGRINSSHAERESRAPKVLAEATLSYWYYWEDRSLERQILGEKFFILGKISPNQQRSEMRKDSNLLIDNGDFGSGGRDRTADLGVKNPTL